MHQVETQITRAAVIWQLLACVLVVLPHLEWLPFWVPLLLLLTLGARLMIHQGRWSFPSRLIKLALVVASSLGLILSFGHQSGPETMVALLIVGMALKLVEVYRRRDALVVIYVAFFVLGTTFLFSSSAWIALYAAAVLTVVISALLAIHQRKGVSVKQTLKRSLWLLGPAVPLMVLLFLIFPRLEPLWSVTLDSPQATTGLSDNLSPGDVSNLARSDELAFRVTFDDEVPAPRQRYWRALVMDRFDGRQWYRSQETGALRPEKLEQTGDTTGYEVVLEATRRPWLVALDQPLSAPTGMQMRPARTLELKQDLNQRYSYQLRAALTYVLQPMLTQAEQQHYVQLPDSGNPEARALAQRWFDEAQGNQQAFIQRMMQHYNQSFVYTLSPGRLLGDSIDRFLFDTQRGYCEHYAAATSFMLRSVGIPARIVTGYQGGEWNPYQGYLQVRQYDAHAWVEVWQEGQGWVRLDPTAAVAPERIESSAESFLRRSSDSLAASRVFRSDWMRSLQLRYDAFNFVWQRWVLNYDREQENLLADWLGGLDYWRLALFLMLPGSVIFAFLAWSQLRRRTPRISDPVDAALFKLQARAGARFNAREPQQSLAHWLETLAGDWPEQEGRLLRLAELDNRRRYAGSHSEREAQAIIKLAGELMSQLPNRTQR